ncbi:MAG: hypothetical protein AVDCRST_MAG05-2012, partial [uncultured Rubrobacteraceae bacterium]
MVLFGLGRGDRDVRGRRLFQRFGPPSSLAGEIGGCGVLRLGSAGRFRRHRRSDALGLRRDDGRQFPRHRLFGRFGQDAGRVGLDFEDGRRVLRLRLAGRIDLATARVGFGFDDLDLDRLRLRGAFRRPAAQSGLCLGGGCDALRLRLDGRLGRVLFQVGLVFRDRLGGVPRLGSAGRIRRAPASAGSFGFEDERRVAAGFFTDGRLGRRALALVGPGLGGGRRVLRLRLRDLLGRRTAPVGLGPGGVRGLHLRPVLVFSCVRGVRAHGDGHGDGFRFHGRADRESA